MDLSKRIFVGITTTSSRRKKDHWREQLKEIDQLGIKEIAIFPTCLGLQERKSFYRELESSSIKEIKLVHLRARDFTPEELDYFSNRFGTKIFNCHEKDFDLAYQKFPKYRKQLALEMNYDNLIENSLPPDKMGGFCLDLSHLYTAFVRQRAEYDYVLRHLKYTSVKANHLNGFSFRRKRDLHFVTDKHQFDYLLELKRISPSFFSRVIAFELENSIRKQLEFKDYILKMIKR
jgi:hypothetical protein